MADRLDRLMAPLPATTSSPRPEDVSTGTRPSDAYVQQNGGHTEHGDRNSVNTADEPADGGLALVPTGANMGGARGSSPFGDELGVHPRAPSPEILRERAFHQANFAKLTSQLETAVETAMEAVSYSASVTGEATAQLALSRQNTLAATEVAMEAVAFSTHIATRTGSSSPEPEPEILSLPAPPGDDGKDEDGRAASPLHDRVDELTEKLARLERQNVRMERMMNVSSAAAPPVEAVPPAAISPTASEASGDPQFQLAHGLSSDGKWMRAVGEYEEFLSLVSPSHPCYGSALADLSNCYAQLGDYGRAEETVPPPLPPLPPHHQDTP